MLHVLSYGEARCFPRVDTRFGPRFLLFIQGCFYFTTFNDYTKNV